VIPFGRLLTNAKSPSTHVLLTKQIQKDDFNLNIRRYVDNSPEPEIDDVQAHLVGGVPRREIARLEQEFRRYGLTGNVMFDGKDENYCLFKPTIETKSGIKEIIDTHPAVASENKKMDGALARWWEAARPAIEALPKHNQVAKFRRESIELLKKQYSTMDVLDEFQHAGVFVNWWEAVRWDMKTIVSLGWSPSLIPDSYIKNTLLGREKAGFHAFRRYRVTHLRKNRGPEDLLRLWIGHADRASRTAIRK
jgi:type I restriction enzyme M protein